MPTCGVYEIWCITSGKVYVGSSRDVAARLTTHFSRLRRGRHENAHLQRAWDCHGGGAFIGFCVAITLPEEQFRTEQECIDRVGASQLYNIGTVAGRGDRYSRRGKRNTDAHNAKIAAANRGRPAWNRGGTNTWAHKAADTYVSKHGHFIRAEHVDGRVLEFTHEAAAARYFNYKRKRVSESFRRQRVLTTGWRFLRVAKEVRHPNV